MICIPITGATHEEALLAVERSALAADAIELRMDLIAAGDLPKLIAAARNASGCVKIIVTCRRPEEAPPRPSGEMTAGKKVMSQTAKMNLLNKAVTMGADFVDIELACGEEDIGRLQAFIRKQKSATRIIVSWHNLSKTPSLAALKSIFQACVRAGADIVKIVPYAANLEDNLKILKLIAFAKARERMIIAMCMGEKGKISRVAAPLLGSFLTFAVLPEGRQSAPGQLTVGEMKQFRRLLQNDESGAQASLTPSGQTNFVLLGNPVGHSLSPLMHNTALAAMKIDGRYSAFCVSDLSAAVTGVRGMNIRGASVTIPFKTSVMEFLDVIDGDAAALGAVNTIVNDGGRLTGFNTDWLGLAQALKVQLHIAGKTFVILGAGGTARAAAYGIQKEGGKVVIANRTQDKGKALAARFDCPFYSLARIGGIKADCLINTTPVGMYPHVEQSPVEAAALANYPVVADVIYNPLMTRLLRDAKAKSCKIISGLEMFVHQGAGQLKLWTGKEAPLALMRKTVRERLEKLES
jgi:shikimate dehydrogenase/3-dehydroquinate dehydratase type I